MTRHATGDGNPAVLISGASTGIGEACALRMHARGFTVYAGVRRTEDGDAVRARAGSDRLVPVLLDVTSEQHIAEVRRRIEAERGGSGLDGLVNNAGIAAAGPLEFLPIPELRRQLEVNVIGQVALTQAMLPALRRTRGRIVFVGSIAGRSALPFVGAYAASKFAVEAIADSLRVELVESGILVSVVEPGVITTPIWRTSLRRAEATLLRDPPPQLEEYYGAALAALRRMAERAGGAGEPPDRVADDVEHALTAPTPRTRYLIGRDARLRLAIERLLPTRLRDRMISRRLKKM
jgi:NAD(P)-dependent dehydrogenase (short-subunit alcohol dehydrogenase family)